MTTTRNREGYIHSNAYGDAWVCQCGNDVMGDGFFPCDPDTANTIEPVTDGPWDGKSVVCMSCRRVMDQSTLRPMIQPLDEDTTHLVDVVRGPRTDVDPSKDEM
jgi:hypothetical protein